MPVGGILRHILYLLGPTEAHGQILPKNCGRLRGIGDVLCQLISRGIVRLVKIVQFILALT